MVIRHRIFLTLVLAVAVCAPPPSDDVADDVLRTGDPYARGYTDADFPRVQELADGVFSYEQLRSAGDERFTTVSLFVVTSEGVLVADGDGKLLLRLQYPQARRAQCQVLLQRVVG